MVDAVALRLHDLVRHQRGAIYDAGLLTDEEYAALAADHGAVARLETYDGMRARIVAMEAALTRLTSPEADRVATDLDHYGLARPGWWDSIDAARVLLSSIHPPAPGLKGSPR